MSGKYALIIGNSEYTDSGLAQLTAPGKDAEEFAHILKSENFCAFDDVKVLSNEPDSIIREHIDELFTLKKPDDLILLYFSGHGIRDEYGSLYLAVKNTNRNRLRSTAIKSDFIREAMDHSRSKRQVLILDCCNSGAFAAGAKSALGTSIGTASAFEGKGYGRIILTASDSTQFAWEGDQFIGETDNSLFTHFLIQGLEGEADRNRDGNISVDELYDYVYGKIVNVTPKQTPGKWSYKEQGEIILRQYIPKGEALTRTEELRRELYEREKQHHVKTQNLRRESEKIKEELTQPRNQNNTGIPSKKQKNLATWFLVCLVFCLLFVICTLSIGSQVLTSIFVVSTMRPEETIINPTTPEIAIPLITSTAIIPLSNKPEEYLKDIQYISLETFDEEISDSWGTWNGEITNGVLKVFEDENWKGATYNKTLKEGEGIIIDFNYTEEHYFEIIIDSSVFGAANHRRFGIYVGDNQLTLNKYDKSIDLVGKVITGDLNLVPNQDYSILLAILPEGGFLISVWNPNEISESMHYQELLGGEWADLNWAFRLQVNKGVVSFDNFYIINFSGAK